LLSEEKKESEVESKSTEESKSEEPLVEEAAKAEVAKAEAEARAASEASAKAEAAAKAVEEAEAAVKEALEKAQDAKAKAEAAAEEEYKAIAAEVKAEAAKAPDYTFKRQGEEIFRREMGEPEFWLEKEDRFPRPILTADQQESLTRKAEMPADQTPEYVPQHVLSPEFGGLSNYERGVGDFLETAKLNLETLKHNPDATEKQIQDAKDEIIYLESLHENFYIGMNVFRTAHGGRDKIKAK
jgi:colicin import membrane protein